MITTIRLLTDALRHIEAGEAEQACADIEKAIEECEAMAAVGAWGEHILRSPALISCAFDPAPHSLADCMAREHERSQS